MNTQQENEIPNMSDNSAAIASVGQALREARERQGLSVNDVANRIKFAPKQIEWLEADDYVRLPEAAFVRGFVRSYARLLGIDSVSLLTALPTSHLQPSSKHEVTSVNIPLPSTLHSRRHNVLWLAAALVIAVSLAIFERMSSRTTNQAGTEENTKTTVQELVLPAGSAVNESSPMAEQTENASNQARQVAEPVVTSQKLPLEEPTPANKVQQKTVELTPPVSTLKPVVPAHAERKVSTSTNVPPASNGNESVLVEKAKANAESTAAEHSLRLEFDEDAWTEIKDGNDKVLISRMHTAGSLVRVTGKAPLLVVIGNAHAVRLFDNGKKINLERFTTAEVARVKLK